MELDLHIKPIAPPGLPEAALTPPPKQTKEEYKERPITKEDIAYSNLLADNPSIGKLVSALGLVFTSDGVEPKVVQQTAEAEPQRKPADATTESKLLLLAENMEMPRWGAPRTMEEIVAAIMAYTKVSRERANNGFKLFLDYGIISKVAADSYSYNFRVNKVNLVN